MHMKRMHSLARSRPTARFPAETSVDPEEKLAKMPKYLQLTRRRQRSHVFTITSCTLIFGSLFFFKLEYIYICIQIYFF